MPHDGRPCVHCWPDCGYPCHRHHGRRGRDRSPARHRRPGPRRTGPDLIGRWIGYLLRGKFRHTDILQTPPLRGELVLGLAAHYLIGIVLTLVYLGLLVVAHATPTALSAILYGTATTVFPWFLMFPSQGMGWLGQDAPGDAHLARVSLFNHIIFGLGIALWMAVMRPI